MANHQQTSMTLPHQSVTEAGGRIRREIQIEREKPQLLSMVLRRLGIILVLFYHLLSRRGIIFNTYSVGAE
jgi:hypothetical protein